MTLCCVHLRSFLLILFLWRCDKNILRFHVYNGMEKIIIFYILVFVLQIDKNISPNIVIAGLFIFFNFFVQTKESEFIAHMKGDIITLLVNII